MHVSISNTVIIRNQTPRSTPPRQSAFEGAFWLFVLVASSVHIAYWGGAFMATFLLPTIELTNRIGFTMGSLTIIAIVSVIGFSVLCAGIVAAESASECRNRLFRRGPKHTS